MSFENLTAQEHRAMAMVCKGLSTGEIAKNLVVSPRTVEGHRSNAIRKLGCRTIANAAVVFDRHIRGEA